MKFTLPVITKKSLLQIAIFLLIGFSSLAAFPFFQMFSLAGPSSETGIPQPLPEVTVDSFGNANATFPIQVPKGTKDITPSLEIEYNSLQSDGLIGGGWDLSGLLTISLDPSKGIHNDGGDSYVSFAGKLVQTSPGIYHTKIESFFQFKKLTDSWVVQDRNGVSYYFGEDGSTENPNSNATLRNLSGSSRIWALNRVRDLHGNGYNIKYQPYSVSNGIPIPERIEYNQGNTVIFFEDEDRSDAIESNLLNFQSKLTKRLRSISVTQKQDDGSVVESEKYTFNYNNNLFDKKNRLSSLDRKNYSSISFNYNNDSPNPSTSSTSKSSPSAINMSYRYENSTIKSDCDFAALVCACSADATCMAVSGGFAGLACWGYMDSIGDMCVNGIVGSQTFLATFDPKKAPEPVWITGNKQSNQLVRYDSSNPGATTPIGGKTFTFNEKSKIFQGDIDGDLVSDFIALENDNVELNISLSLTGANFNSISIPAILKSNPNSYQGLIDLNSDGKSDFVQTDPSNNFLIYLASGGNLNTNPTILNIPGIGTSFRQFVDMDNDGIADYVRMTDNPDGSKNLSISFLRYSGGNFSVRTTTSSYIGVAGTEGDRFLADSNGDGYLDLITFSADNNLYVYLSDGHVVRSPLAFPVSYTIPYYEVSSSIANSKRYSLRDMNWDGAPDRISLVNNGFQIDLYNPTTSSFDTTFEVSNDGTQVKQFDVNWDGNLDSISFYTFFFNGTGFHVKNGSDDSNTDVVFDYNETVPVPPNPALMASDSAKVYSNFVNTKAFADVDGDAKADFIRFQNGTIYVSYSRSKNNGLFYSNGGDVSFPAASFSIATDTNQDGRSDFIGFRASMRNLVNDTLVNNLHSFERNSIAHGNMMDIDYVEPSYSKKISQGLLTDILGTQEKGIQISYANTYESSNPSVTNAINLSSMGATIKPNLAPYSVATNVYSQVASGYGEAESYIFENGRVYIQDQDNRSMLGFAKVTSANSRTGEKQISLFQGTNLNFAGIETKRDEYLNNRLISSSTFAFTSLTSPFGTTNIRKTQELETKYQDSSILSSYQTDFTYDSYNNILSKITQVDSNPSLTLSEEYIYNPSLVDWVLSETVQRKKSKGGNLAAFVEITYSNHLVNDVKTLLKAGATDYLVQSVLSYDSYGNPTSIREPSGNINLIEYDSIVHNYPVKLTNSLGLEIQRSYDYVFGNEISSIDPNGKKSEKLYDFFGRLIGTKYAGETDWSEIVEYIQTGNPSGEKVKKTIQDSKTGNSWVQETHDPYGQIIKTESLAADAIVIVTDKEYYSNGLLKSKTEPYIGLSPFLTMTYLYDLENKVTSISDTSGKKVDFTYSGSNTGTITTVNSTQTSSLSVAKNGLGEILSKTENGRTTLYSYNSNGKTTQIRDPEGNNVNFVYNLVGQKISQTTSDTGTTNFQISLSGKVLEQRNANGSYTTYQYDTLDRPIRVIGNHSNGTIKNVQLNYDESGTANGQGRVTSIIDSIGKTDFQYDARGNQIRVRKYLNQEDLTLIFLKEYDLGNRVTDLTYPNGTVIHNQYTPAGYLTSITMDLPDGSSSGHPVVNYVGPLIEGGKFKVQRTVGNGVQTNIFFDPINQRPTEIVTGIDSDIYESLKYEYDPSGNITKIEDLRNPGRTQNFQYDTFNRLINASGKYGAEDYQYSVSGNLIKKGSNTYSYGGSNAHAVTQIVSPQGTKIYSYDSSGLMTNRDGDVLEYDPMGKLQKMITKDGETLTYDYDYKGSRIRKSKQSDGTSVVSLDGDYEVSSRPGYSPLHTLYIKGLGGDIVSQLSLENVSLLSDAQFETDKTSELASMISHPENSYCKGIAGDCRDYYKNKVYDLYLSGIEAVFAVQNGRIGNQFRLSVISLFGICLVGFLFSSAAKAKSIQIFELAKVGITPILLLSVFVGFNFYSCGLLPGTGNKNGDPPWVVFPSTIPTDTPSVSNPGNGSGGGPIGGTPVPGMIFFHPNHLGSISMATNGAGKPISGGSAVGTSFVSYKPYGEILRTDSYGPDVFRNKYTGQEEDKESGLLYYKSRYYDPSIARFIQADSIVNGDSISGNNLFMYVDGNPISYRDPGGQINIWHMFMEIIKHMIGGIKLAAKAFDGTMRAIGRSIDHSARAIARSIDQIGRTIGHSIDHTWRPILRNADKGARKLLRNADHGAREFFSNVDHGARKIGRGIDGEVREILSGGKYSRNSGTREWSLNHSDLAKWMEGWDWTLIVGGGIMILIGILTLNPGLVVWGIMTVVAGITGGDFAPEGSGGSEGAG
ncbi:RHS repeat-associated core domain protein [Leptospira santarosai str. HAI821]|uniref:RHS repeat-associated core domain-containing protein n=1 Tax=Leptospira santarosai TaxID=28183 RepID=UPI0002BE7440|nr:RHS repeat-associated core domain-containing protein [Leptospira santarosai]EMO33298.1 RHS repeat-associated core domain protein [Leptospira santarosai str. HAI821]